jgi:hypothetical protein
MAVSHTVPHWGTIFFWPSKGKRPVVLSSVQLASKKNRYTSIYLFSTICVATIYRVTIKTQGHACPNLNCRYFGVTDETVHALVGNGKRGKDHHIQTLRCQCCLTSFSTRRNTPLYHLKTHPDQVEMCLWLLAEGMDISV